MFYKDYLPVYFQAVLGASPIRSGVDLLGLAMFITPSAMACGASVQVFRKYRPQNILGWVLIIVGFGILTLLDRESNTARYIGCQIVLGVGLGIIWVATSFPILAPLPYSNNAHALAFYAFNRNLSQVWISLDSTAMLLNVFQTWGIAIGGAVLQNQLTKQLPLQYRSTLAKGTSIAYAAIPLLPTIPEPLQTEVRDAFARSLRVLWEVMIGIAGIGLLTVLLMKEIEMRTDVDQQWGLKKEKGSVDQEASIGESDS